MINKHFNFCCFRASASTSLDRMCAVFLYKYDYECCVKLGPTRDAEKVQ